MFQVFIDCGPELGEIFGITLVLELSILLDTSCSILINGGLQLSKKTLVLNHKKKKTECTTVAAKQMVTCRTSPVKTSGKVMANEEELL